MTYFGEHTPQQELLETVQLMQQEHGYSSMDMMIIMAAVLNAFLDPHHERLDTLSNPTVPVPSTTAVAPAVVVKPATEGLTAEQIKLDTYNVYWRLGYYNGVSFEDGSWSEHCEEYGNISPYDVDGTFIPETYGDIWKWVDDNQLRWKFTDFDNLPTPITSNIDDTTALVHGNVWVVVKYKRPDSTVPHVNSDVTTVKNTPSTK